MITRLFKKLFGEFGGSAKRAAIFEIIHIPVDIGVVGLLTGSWEIAVGAVLIQHFVVFILHTLYDRYSYDQYYKSLKNGGENEK